MAAAEVVELMMQAVTATTITDMNVRVQITITAAAVTVGAATYDVELRAPMVKTAASRE